MARHHQRRQGKPALELIEEAVHLLRRAPAAALASYFVGTLPFVLGLLYFWADMSRGAFAYERCAAAALGVAALFVWMKTWQAMFARQLRGHLSGRREPGSRLRHFWGAARIQAAVQPTALFVLPLALLIMLPFGWAYAFYQNITALGSGETTGIRQALRRAAVQSTLWPLPNHLILAILFLFAFFVFLNVAVGLIQIPMLLKMFLGIDTAFSLSSHTMFNTTFLAVVAAVTYLCVDPIAKTVYVLRCFYGESLVSGEDLKAELQSYLPAGTTGVVMAMLLCFSGAGAVAGPDAVPHFAQAEGVRAASGQVPDATAPGAAPRVSPPDLDRSIDHVLGQRQYTWRLPREKRPESEKAPGLIGRFLNAVFDTIMGWLKTMKGWIKSFMNWIADVWEWLMEKFFGKERPEVKARERGDWITGLQALAFVLFAIVLACLAILFWRAWARRRKAAPEVVGQPMLAPDLRDENIVASQLPEDGWLKLARELMEKGDLRLALRALYFASLAHLAGRNMIGIEKFKSNRDYERELRRRTRALPELQTAFAENVTMFDRIWYGMHPVTPDGLEEFQNNFEKIKTC